MSETRLGRLLMDVACVRDMEPWTHTHIRTYFDFARHGTALRCAVLGGGWCMYVCTCVHSTYVHADTLT